MATMNLSTQKRLGVLPKTEETLTYTGHIYGNTHRPFVGRKPTPTAKGFFGVHGFGAASGDGKLHYFGDGPGQADLPMNGFYGIGMAEMDYQAGEMLIQDPAEMLPTNPAGIYGALTPTATAAGIVMFAGGLWIGNNSKDGMTSIPALGLMGAGLYTFMTNAAKN